MLSLCLVKGREKGEKRPNRSLAREDLKLKDECVKKGGRKKILIRSWPWGEKIKKQERWILMKGNQPLILKKKRSLASGKKKRSACFMNINKTKEGER